MIFCFALKTYLDEKLQHHLHALDVVTVRKLLCMLYGVVLMQGLFGRRLFFVEDGGSGADFLFYTVGALPDGDFGIFVTFYGVCGMLETMSYTGAHIRNPNCLQSQSCFDGRSFICAMKKGLILLPIWAASPCIGHPRKLVS